MLLAGHVRADRNYMQDIIELLERNPHHKAVLAALDKSHC